MNILYENRKNCYDLSSSDSYVKQWANNETSDTVIPICLFPFVPHLFYTQHNSTHYQWCGPLLYLAQGFAKLSKTRIKLSPLRSAEELIRNVRTQGATVTALPSISLMPFIASQYYRFVVMNNNSEFRRLSPILSYAIPDRVLAKTMRDEYILFKPFECLESEVYYAMIASIIMISCLIGCSRMSLKSFLTTFWSHLSVVLSDYYSLPIKSNRWLSGAWLLVCTVILSAFSGQLRGQLIKPKRVHWIDSWEELYEWKHITKIQTLSLSNFINYIHVFEKTDPMAKYFSSRVEEMRRVGDMQYLKGKVYSTDNTDYEGVKRGSVALVYPEHYLQIHKQKLSSDHFVEDFDFHISKSGDTPQPVFTETNRLNLNDSLLVHWDLVINIMRESGIYDFLFKVGLNPRRIGPDSTDQIGASSFEVKNMSLAQMKVIFILITIFEVFTIFLFFTEVLTFLLTHGLITRIKAYL